MTVKQTAREMGATARAATWAEADALGRTMARAFADDPLICFLLRDPATRATKAPRLFKLLFKLALPFGASDITSGYEAAALWRPPGQWEVPFWQYLTNGPEFLSVFGVGGALHVLKVMDYIEKRHPHEPHWYLQAIATDPDQQGKGFGGLIMRHQLATVDASGLPAYLESSKEKNIPIYASFGFRVTEEIKVPSGPTLYAMWRDAQPQP
jgi:ribosomal protein S18 acetylase RimI-like enzyme